MITDLITMDATYLLILERFDRNDSSEGTKYLLFSNRTMAEDFARSIATDYYECGLLPDEGNFETQRLKGDILRYKDEFTISWTMQPKEPGGSIGDSYYLTVQPVKAHSPEMRLDFWNQL